MRPAIGRFPPEQTATQRLGPDAVNGIAKKRIEALAAKGVFAKAAEAMTNQMDNTEFVEEVMGLMSTAIAVEGQSVKTMGLNQTSLHAFQTVVRR